jgi:putative two-component system response regulator
MMEPTASGAPSGAERDVILVADDNEQNLQLLEEYLWQWGHEVVSARNGLEAVELFPQHNPSLVVLDVMMPVMDGYEACERIKATPQGRRVPIIMLTALTGTDDKIRALEKGADDFLNKPINREELRTRIRSLIRIRNLRRELDSSEDILVTLTSALESKDPRCGGHVQRVAAYSGQICDRLGLTAGERETVVKGALLHDVGKIGVPDEILLKEDLDEAEYGRMLEHTVMGASILEPMVTFRQFIPIVRSHHERWDGNGYPDRLAGEAIPLEARIVAAADRYDEIRHTLQPLPALDRLRAEASSGGFDPLMVELLGDAINDAPPRKLPAAPRLMHSARNPTVLCADDSELNRALIRETLESNGFRVVEATDGRDALDVLRSGTIDLVILDLAMPEQNGQTTLEAIRHDERFEFLPVIVLTAHRHAEHRNLAITGGADDFLNYPLNRLELVTRIRSLLRIRDYHGDLEQTQNVICALALAIEAKDEYTEGHSRRVGDLAYGFALRLGLPVDEAERIRTAGLLHDIGKIAVPEALLNKPGPLTRDEFLRVIDHPVIGEEMCRPLHTLTSVLQLIRHHHERYDGRGYPDGLRGEEIPYDVRLLSITDAYDALTSHRSYRAAPLTHEAALETLRQEAAAGKWDPLMVREFCSMLTEDGPATFFAKFSLPVPTLRLRSQISA